MKHFDKDTDLGRELLAEASAYYMALEPFRKERLRNKRYNYGDQWSDRIEVDGRTVTEEQYIREQGCIPLKNNLIRRLVRNVTGVYNSRATEPVCVARDSGESRLGDTLTALLRYVMQVNRMSALYTRSVEEFLISGMVVHRKSYGRRCGRTDCWTDYVQPCNFFVDNRMRDFRGWDCTCVGEIHDVTLDEVCRQFASDATDCRLLGAAFAAGADAGGAFLRPSRQGMCRVVEIWRKELTAGASGMNDVWRYYFVAPSGLILARGDTPYAHRSHPYVFKAYPMIDGEIHSFVGDVVDQQRYTNRLITLYDWIMRASSKGVLLVPSARPAIRHTAFLAHLRAVGRYLQVDVLGPLRRRFDPFRQGGRRHCRLGLGERHECHQACAASGGCSSRRHSRTEDHRGHQCVCRCRAAVPHHPGPEDQLSCLHRSCGLGQQGFPARMEQPCATPRRLPGAYTLNSLISNL